MLLPCYLSPLDWGEAAYNRERDLCKYTTFNEVPLLFIVLLYALLEAFKITRIQYVAQTSEILAVMCL